MPEMSEIQKPRFTEPCNHCGLCCRVSLCHVGEIMHPKHVVGPCPSLIVHDGTQKCGLVILEAALPVEPVVAKQLGIGCGCSMMDDDTTWTEWLEFDRKSQLKMFPKSHA